MKDKFTLETEESLPTPERLAVECSDLLAVAFGGGTNSTAKLCGFRELGIKPDLILFADTGAEMPGTYEHVEEMRGVVKEWWGMDIETVRATYKKGFEGLEGECLRLKNLPSLAYGTKKCSQKYKIAPQERYLRDWAKEQGEKSLKCAVGYDASEGYRRAKAMEGLDIGKGVYKFNWYPLIEWGWMRQDCIDAIARHGITQPGKSACYFCPAMKRGEILRMKKKHPELFQRALKIEANAEVKSIGRGLGGQSLRWENVDAEDEAQAKLWNWLDENDESPIPCGCFDG